MMMMSVTAVCSPSTPNQALPDVQSGADPRGIALHAAGVREVEMPLNVLQRNGQPQRVTATASLSVGLRASDKGTHMSRFVIQLNEWSQQKTFTPNLKSFLQEMRERLEAPSAFADLQFIYFMDKPAPVTGIAAPCGYHVHLKGHLDETRCDLFVKVRVPMATCCPCSKAISDFGAHNQRALYEIDLHLKESDLESPLWIEDIVELADNAASCAVYPLLKRADEKWVTERQYSNPKFVEDVCRDLALALREHPAVAGFKLTAEALESIHPHNAWAAYHENYPMLGF